MNQTTYSKYVRTNRNTKKEVKEMNQRQVFSNMQTTMSIGDTNDNALGGLVIVSALLTELALLGILAAEEDKILFALEIPGVTAEELADVDNSVARVLKQVCCIEKQIVKKIELGIDLRNGNGNGNGHCNGHGNGPGKGLEKD